MQNIMRYTALSGLVVMLLAGGAAPRAETALTILHINDLHSRIQPINKYDSTCSAEDDKEGKCFGGVARIKSWLDNRRAQLSSEGKNFLTLDAGDQFQGSLFYTTYKGEAAAEFAEAIGFDAMAVGNHEFDDGPPALANFIDRVSFPVLSGNIDVEAETALKGKIPKLAILTIGDDKIAIVSALAVDTAETSSPGPNVLFLDVVDYLKSAVAELTAAGIDKIIALTHVGLPVDEQIAAHVSGIDLIVGGHSHTLLSNQSGRAAGPYPVLVNNPQGQKVPIVQAYAYGKYVGEIELIFDDNGHVISASGDTILMDSAVVADQKIAARIGELEAPIASAMKKTVGSSAAVINGERAICRTGECEMGNLVADAMLEAIPDAQIAIQNGGGLRASIDAGPVTMGEVLTVLPFQNTLATFELSGADVISALENGVSQVEEVKGRFPQVAGIRYKWSSAIAPNAGRIKNVEIFSGGAFYPLDLEKTYKIVTNNYMRGGGDGYDIFQENGQNAYDYGPNLEEVVADYIGRQDSAYTPYLDQRIIRTD